MYGLSGARLQNCCWFLMLLAGYDVYGLKDVSVTIPPAVRIMDTVTLQCRYDLEGEPLYTVKWYKGTKEFYRYIPKELPNTQVFPLPGITVDLSKSTPNEVVLKNVQPEVTGKYKCEVSSDAPNFYTYIQSGYMYVIDVPVDDPIMSVDKELIEVGSTLRGNCSAPASYPPANITWFLNGKRIPQSYVKHVPEASTTSSSLQPSRRSKAITVSGLELEIDSGTFQGGKAKLVCLATVFNLYDREKQVILEEERPRPRPSSVLGTRDSSSGSSLLPIDTIISVSLLAIAFALR